MELYSGYTDKQENVDKVKIVWSCRLPKRLRLLCLSKGYHLGNVKKVLFLRIVYRQ